MRSSVVEWGSLVVAIESIPEKAAAKGRPVGSEQVCYSDYSDGPINEKTFY